ncbi:Major centromere autoantigen B [Neolecta irregularis DAH-3]|uniref:Major centromere autoantigen B n=1 Tax=Neolecta irregularis (strain DAH-3) TaxID=1198029 RepID=A0A1U7LRT0_NEOID|nr:Major centromere autoantigen B [Neolecta irregularis DAH-3]|eukprot:OLL25380.1 Major centromere autoantigen B [Neolecta irregularis DAH-3]
MKNDCSRPCSAVYIDFPSVASQSTYTPGTQFSLDSNPASHASSPSELSIASTAPSPNGTKLSSKRKAKLSDTDRKNICLKYLENPSMKQDDIAKLFGVERSTVSKVLRQKEKYLAMDRETRQVDVDHRIPELERMLAKWAQRVVASGQAITDFMILQRARETSQMVRIPEPDFQIDMNWLQSFKDRAGLVSVLSAQPHRSYQQPMHQTNFDLHVGMMHYENQQQQESMPTSQSMYNLSVLSQGAPNQQSFQHEFFIPTTQTPSQNPTPIQQQPPPSRCSPVRPHRSKEFSRNQQHPYAQALRGITRSHTTGRLNQFQVPQLDPPASLSQNDSPAHSPSLPSIDIKEEDVLAFSQFLSPLPLPQDVSAPSSSSAVPSLDEAIAAMKTIMVFLNNLKTGKV